MIRRVAIYLDPGGQLSDQYVLSFLCGRWYDAGVEIVVIDDPTRRVEADVGIMHVDRTRRSAAYDHVLESYPRVINGSVRDISKRHISANLVERGSSWSGPVIVKTNTNCFDLPDFDRRWKESGTVQRFVSRVIDRLLPTRRDIRRTHSYSIYESVRHVPRLVRWDRRLVVEKFLPERRGDLYCLRTWVFFGAREKALLSVSAKPVVKSENTIKSEFVDEIPVAIRETRRRLGFDFGKFDFVIHQGEAVLLDTNSTPTCGGKPSPRLNAIVDELAAGLFDEAELRERQVAAS
jgi:hypothetical protein